MATIQSFFHKLLIIVSSIFLLLGIASFFTMSDNGANIMAKLLYAVIGIIFLFLGSGGAFLFYALPKRCKQCKKWFAVQKGDTVLFKSKNIYTVVENKTRSAYTGDVTATTEQHVPGTRTTYKTAYKCKYCGFEKYSYKSIDKPNT